MESRTKIHATIESITNLPTLPAVVDRITRLLQNPQTTAEEIGKAITVDQALASKVLKLVNSAFYGFPGKISTITHAIVILGFSTIKNIVLTTSIFDVLKSGNVNFGKFKIEDFWYHSIACGAASQSIAKFIGFEERETAFIAGLVHDIGKTLLCKYLPQEFTRIIKTAEEKEKLFYECEQELFGITHTEIGDMLANQWKLPENLRFPIRYHHEPSSSRDHYILTAIVHCADILVRALDYGNGGDNKIPRAMDSVWTNLGMENISLQSLLENIHEEVRKATVFMQI